jgi:hypothetical protein
MQKRLSAKNKRFQTLKNALHIGECTRHDGIEQEVVGRLIPSYPGYLDQYLGGAGEMHIHIGWFDRRPIIKVMESVKIDVKRDYCIILQKLCSSGQPFSPRDGCIRQVPNSKTHSDILHTITDGYKLTMLICVFESADDSQIMSTRIESNLGGLVRLQPYDECPSLRMQTLNCNFGSLSQLGIIDHELSVFVSSKDVLKKDWETRVLAALFWDGCDNNVIKCTSQVVYEITEHDGNHRIRLLSDLEAAPDLILAIRQPNPSESVRVAACVPDGLLLDVYHVLLSTPNLEPPIGHLLYSKYKGRKNGNTKNPEGFRDTSSQAQGRVRRARKGSKTHQTSSSPPPPEEVESRTVPFHRRGDYIAKHIHSGSLEDV